MSLATFPLIASLLAASPAGESDSTRAVKASLIAEVDSIQPGRSLWVGVRLQMAPGWHTYWKNPGDSGLPTRVAWTLPPGFVAGPLLWPYPERLASGPLMDYGYREEVLLLTEISPGADLVAGGSAVLGAQVKWLECREKCLPGKEDLSLALPVTAQAPRNAGRWASLFEATRRRIPTDAAGWRLRSHKTKANAVDLLPPRGSGPGPREAYFFSEEPERLEHAARQRIGASGATWWLELEKAANAPKTTEGLRGVLVFKKPGQGEVRALSIEARP